MEKENKELGISLNKKTMAAITLVLVAVLAFIGVLTQILPRGEYQIAMQDGHEVIVDGTYTLLEDYKMPVWKIILSPILCLASSQATTGISIILIIVLIGGSFLILDKCGILKYIMAFLIKNTATKSMHLWQLLFSFVCF